MATTLKFDETAARRLAAMYSTADVEAQRREALRLLSLASGEQVLDVGCGPGFLCENMSDRVGPTGRVLGIDISDDLIEFARGRNERGWLTYSKGDAAKLAAANDSFDVVVCTQVLEYVASVDQSISEIHRVLRPGGRALILDADWDTVMWHSDDPERMARMLRAWEGHCTDSRLPRTLEPRLRAAGFRVEGASAFAYVNTRLDDQAYSAGLIDLIANFVERQDNVPAGEPKAWAAELRSLSEQGRYFFSSTRYFFRATKPA